MRRVGSTRSRAGLIVFTAVLSALVVPAVIPHTGDPLPTPAAAVTCTNYDVFGTERSTVGLVQYKIKFNAYFCIDVRRSKISYYKVTMQVTHTGPFWSERSAVAEGHWQTWHGRLHGSRYELRVKAMEGCITNIGGCLKTKHPEIQVWMRANNTLVIAHNKDIHITKIAYG